MPNETDGFKHGDFWDDYSRRWEGEVRPRIDGEILGDEWARPERSRFIFERFAAPYLTTSATVVEIGPGGGKFSRRLVDRCAKLLLVDISREMLRRASHVCAGRAHQVVIDDGDLGPIASGTVDLVFSYDVFIHLESEEVFRYFSEVNRILRPGGVFSVHTSSFESRWGFHSYLQQLRDHRPDFGRRYGGRMYPMTEGILRRFAEHSGFESIDSFANWEDRDILLALRKKRPARPWTFITSPELYQRYELSERVGGSDRRELYAGLVLGSGKVLVLAVGDAEDPWVVATADAAVPDHPCLAAPRGLETSTGVGVVFFDELRGRALSHREATGLPQYDDRTDFGKELGRLLEGLLEAHSAGLAHGELDSRFVLQEVSTGKLRLFGLLKPSGAEEFEKLSKSDLAAVAPLLEVSADTCGAAGEVLEIAAELSSRPNAFLVSLALEKLAG